MDIQERMNQLLNEISTFERLPSEFIASGYSVDIKDKYAFTVSSKNAPQDYLNNKKYEYFLSALVHGNEVGGVSTLNTFAKKILKDKSKISHFLFCLGNVDAALKGERFLERDLNRSFLIKDHKLLEEKLALRIESLAKHCAFSIDIHQTNQDCSTPFMIFFYSAQRMAYARYLNPKIPIITSTQERHKDGSTMDFFCFKNNILNVTLELGKVGFSKEQQEFGVQFLQNTLNGKKDFPKSNFSNVYKILESIYWENEQIILNPGFVNFQAVQKDQSIGKIGQKDYLNPHEGVILFPKYGDVAKKTNEVYTIAVPAKGPEDL